MRFVLFSLCVLLSAFGGGHLFAMQYDDEIIRHQGVLVMYITYQPIEGRERQTLIKDMRLHSDTLLRLSARHYYGGGGRNSQRVEIQFMEPQDKQWHSFSPGGIVGVYIERHKESILAQLRSRI